eukprot:scaffold7012_cov33-Phaeocystis_antarctica.AAC.1
MVWPERRRRVPEAALGAPRCGQPSPSSLLGRAGRALYKASSPHRPSRYRRPTVRPWPRGAAS